MIFQSGDLQCIIYTELNVTHCYFEKQCLQFGILTRASVLIKTINKKTAKGLRMFLTSGPFNCYLVSVITSNFTFLLWMCHSKLYYIDKALIEIQCSKLCFNHWHCCCLRSGHLHTLKDVMSDPHAPGSCEPGVHLTLYGCPLCSVQVHLKCKLQELGIGTVGCRMSLLRSVASGALRLFSFFSWWVSFRWRPCFFQLL